MSRRFLLLLWVLLIPITTVKAVLAADVEFHNDGPLAELGLALNARAEVECIAAY